MLFFLNNIHKNLLATMEAIEKVNEEHHMIMHMVDRMNDEYKRVEKSTVENHNNSRTMLEKGKSLLQSTREMVNISKKEKSL